MNRAIQPKIVNEQGYPAQNCEWTGLSSPKLVNEQGYPAQNCEWTGLSSPKMKPTRGYPAQICVLFTNNTTALLGLSSPENEWMQTRNCSLLAGHVHLWWSLALPSKAAVDPGWASQQGWPLASPCLPWLSKALGAWAACVLWAPKSCTRESQGLSSPKLWVNRAVQPQVVRTGLSSPNLWMNRAIQPKIVNEQGYPAQTCEWTGLSSPKLWMNRAIQPKLVNEQGYPAQTYTIQEHG